MLATVRRPAFVWLHVGLIARMAQALTRDARTVAGGGATEMELARQLAALGRKETGLEQYAIAKFSEALEVSVLVY